ncbi:hypothetical protein K6U27_04570 [Vibrio fluvialis]|uniref:hypothetical protein n=1 Tax=Vibrio fluvialis TaxID=676 RepID=UPI001EEBB258|nr:hypothetical protein [Vibrio fluvialis]MCG6371970.1 hypothetical protein [Vibrio fluvialis]
MAKKVTISELMIKLSVDSKKAAKDLQKLDKDLTKLSAKRIQATKAETSSTKKNASERAKSIRTERAFIDLKKRDRQAAAKFEKKYTSLKSEEARKRLRDQLQQDMKFLKKLDTAKGKSRKLNAAREKLMAERIARADVSYRRALQNRQRAITQRNAARDQRLATVQRRATSIAGTGALAAAGAGALTVAGAVSIGMLYAKVSQLHLEGLKYLATKDQSTFGLADRYLNQGYKPEDAKRMASDFFYSVQRQFAAYGMEPSTAVRTTTSLSDTYGTSLKDSRAFAFDLSKLFAARGVNDAERQGYLASLFSRASTGLEQGEVDALEESLGGKQTAALFGFRSMAEMKTAAKNSSGGMKDVAFISSLDVVMRNMSYLIKNVDALRKDSASEALANFNQEFFTIRDQFFERMVNTSMGRDTSGNMLEILQRLTTPDESGTSNIQRLADAAANLTNGLVRIAGELVDSGVLEEFTKFVSGINADDMVNGFREVVAGLKQLGYVLERLAAIMGYQTPEQQAEHQQKRVEARSKWEESFKLTAPQPTSAFSQISQMPWTGSQRPIVNYNPYTPQVNNTVNVTLDGQEIATHVSDRVGYPDLVANGE